MTEIYTVVTSDEPIVSKYPPINCTGFETSITLVKELFDHCDGYPLLNEYDESTHSGYFSRPQIILKP